MKLACACAVVFAAGLVCAAPSAARAQAPKAPTSTAALATRTAKFALEKGVVDVSVAWRDALDAAALKKLTNGLPTVVTTRAYVFRETGGDPVALAAKSCRVVYDLWDELFRIELTQAGGSSTRVALSVDGVLRICAEARRMPLVERAVLSRTARYYAAFLVEVNPLSATLLDRIKRWVSRPSGTSALGAGDALFGSFVGLFVTRVQSADRRVSFRTQAFTTP